MGFYLQMDAIELNNRIILWIVSLFAQRSVHGESVIQTLLPFPGLAFDRTADSWSMSFESNCAFLRMDPFTRRVWSSISIPAILVDQKDKAGGGSVLKCLHSHLKSSISSVSMFGIGSIPVHTWSCWSCWLGPASPPASDSSNRDCRRCRSYLEARAARQPTAGLCLGSGLREQRGKRPAVWLTFCS